MRPSKRRTALSLTDPTQTGNTGPNVSFENQHILDTTPRVYLGRDNVEGRRDVTGFGPSCGFL